LNGRKQLYRFVADASLGHLKVVCINLAADGIAAATRGLSASGKTAIGRRCGAAQS
jgi:hypothetical protein